MVVSALALLTLSNPSTPASAIKEYVEAWNKRDVPGIKALLIGTDHASRAEVPQDSILSYTEGAVSIIGETARVRISLTVHLVYQDVHIQDKVDLRRIGEGWKLVPVAEADPAGYLHVLQWFGSSTFVETELLSGDEIDASPSEATLWNARHLASAMLRYRTSNGGRFMRQGADPHKLIQPFLRNDRFWTAPRPESAGFSINAKLLGLNARDIPDPDHTILVYEGSGGTITVPKGRTAAVAFASGRVALITAPEILSLKWTP